MGLFGKDTVMKDMPNTQEQPVQQPVQQQPVQQPVQQQSQEQQQQNEVLYYVAQSIVEHRHIMESISATLKEIRGVLASMDFDKNKKTK